MFAPIQFDEYTPPKANGWNLKIPPLEKEKHRTKPPIFSGSISNFGGVIFAPPEGHRRFSRKHHKTNGAQHGIDNLTNPIQMGGENHKLIP